jgi:hypothetical protein
MSIRMMKPVPYLFALALVLAANPADAQGRRGNDKDKGKDRQEEVRRDDEDRRPVLQRRAVRDVPRGWCQGRGNPHNTVENCGYQADRAYDGDRDYRGGSYEQEHAEFHRYLDDRYRTLAAQRPLDIRRQLELRAQKSAEHDRWHAQAGRRHDSL